MEKIMKLIFHHQINVKYVMDLEQSQDQNLFLALHVGGKVK